MDKAYGEKAGIARAERVPIILAVEPDQSFFGQRMFTVIDNNTRALLEVSAMVAKTCEEIEGHEASTVESRKAVDRIDSTVGRIDTRTEGMDRKLDRLVERE